MSERKPLRLTEMVAGSGWASKLGPGDLDRVLCGMKFPADSNVLVGLEKADDAGVYKISDELAMIQTVDFFTPIVDDPYWFGQIAAANALSDIYAMGGVPKTAMNLVAFPAKDMDLDVLRQIIQGGIDKLVEAGVSLIGGHSIEDKEPKFGLAVTGFVHPDRILTKRGLKLGDDLVLTKPIGTGIINTAIKGGMASASAVTQVTAIMAALNREAAAAMDGFRVSACTDITGFGLIGHLAEMIQDSPFGIRLSAEKVPVISEVREYAGLGLIPAGAYRNREFRQSMVSMSPEVDPILQDILFDPQTSGGLLIAVEASQSKALADALSNRGVQAAAIIGRVVSQPVGRIVVE